MAEAAFAALFFAAGQLRLLGPGRTFAREHPHRAALAFIVWRPDEGRVPVGRERGALAQSSFAALRFAADQLWGLLDERLSGARDAIREREPEQRHGQRADSERCAHEQSLRFSRAH